MNQIANNATKIILSAILLMLCQGLFSQAISPKYFWLINRADSFYNAQQYKSSALAYSEAFKINNSKVTANSQYNAACSWALTNNTDSSFFLLSTIAINSNYTNYEHIATDPDLNSLHNDARWKPLLEIIKTNKKKAEANLNRLLVAQLDSIYAEDQDYRLGLGGIQEKFGWKSKEVRDQWEIIIRKDSINLKKIEKILDTYGWPGKNIVGEQGNRTLFLVIQHARLSIQEKYLPMMRDAVEQGIAYSSELALLEDRVALGEGKKQIYGSQIAGDLNTHLYYVRPLEDPDNVDIKRAEMGLEPLEYYVSQWKIKWDIEQYKKDLPNIEKMEKILRKAEALESNR